MNKLKYGWWIVVVVGLLSCSEDDEYEYIEKLPIGGFMKKELLQKADYFVSETEKITVPMKMNRMKPEQELEVKIGLEVEPLELSSAVVLLKKNVSFSGSAEIKTELLSIDWSKVPAGKEVKARLSLLKDDAIDLNTRCVSLEVKASKAVNPIPWCNPEGVAEIMLDYTATTAKKMTLQLLSMTKPAAQDLLVPFTLETDLVEGKDFRILGKHGHAFFVPAGAEKASIEVEVSGDIFPQPRFEWIKLELTEQGKDPVHIFEYDAAWKSTWLKVGRMPDKVYELTLDPKAEYKALLAAGEPDKEISVTIPDVLNKPAEKDLAFALNLNQYRAKLGEHFQMTEPYQLILKKGSRDAQLVLTVLGSAFTSNADNVPLYIELADKEQATGAEHANYWTTIVLGRE